MTLWPLLFLVFLIQEPVSASAVLLEAYQYHYNVWIIHLLFVMATLLDATVGYALGVWIKKRLAGSDAAFVRYSFRKADELSKFIGRKGKRISLVIYGPILFPYSAVIAPWLDVPFSDAVMYLFIGDTVFWYGSEWLVVLGIKTFVPNPITALYYVLAVAILIGVGLQYLRIWMEK